MERDLYLDFVRDGEIGGSGRIRQLYFDLIPKELNTLIFSKFDYDLALSLDGELDFKDMSYELLIILRDFKLYHQIKFIVSLSKSLNFINFKKYIPPP